MRPVQGRFDIVITSNSGYPLDQNLYQAIKGVSAAAEIVRDGGTIICAAECRDGLPAHGNYAQILASAELTAALLEVIAASPRTIPDQWQVQIQARVQQRARVLIHADGLSDEQIRAAHLEPVTATSAKPSPSCWRTRPDARIAVLPQGPADDRLRRLTVLVRAVVARVDSPRSSETGYHVGMSSTSDRSSMPWMRLATA